MKYLNIDQYKDLCRICDEILAEGECSLESIANGWLHVLNEHPSNLNKYKNLYRNGESQWISLIRRYKNRAVVLMYLICRAIRGGVKKKYETSFDLSLEKADIVLVSHLANEDQIGKPGDFYYGMLGDELHKQGYSCAIILINHTNLKSKSLKGAWGMDLAPRIVLGNANSLRSEFEIQQKMNRESLRLNLIAKKNSKLKKKIYNCASEKAISNEAISNFRIYTQINELLKNLKPKTLVVTYEGHAWERLAFVSARNQGSKILCIGYQHTVLFPNQHALMRSLGYKYDPDIILTTGIKLREKILRSSNCWKSENIYSVGSHRREILGENIEDKLSFVKNQLLAAADGTLEENILIIDFVLRLAIKMPDIKFIIRFHPIIKIQNIARIDRRINELPQNVFLSQKKLVDDLMASSWVIYRGSGVSIQSIFAGARPLYLHREGELKIDPLIDLNQWKKEITTTLDAERVILHDISANSKKLLNEYRPAYEYCNKYQEPINLKLFMDIVSKVE